jgi:Glycosyltransferase family 87
MVDRQIFDHHLAARRSPRYHLTVEGSRTAIPTRSDAVAVAPAVALFLGLAVHQILLNPTWVGDDGDDGAYFLMSRNVWRYGAPLLDQSGSAHWSISWSPGLSILLAPLGALPMAPSVVAERIVVMLTGVAFLVLGYAWMRRQLGLSRLWAGLATACVAATYALTRVGGLVLSDVPAAAAVMGGVVLLRRGRTRAGLALLALAAVVRPVNVVALAAAIAWLLLTHRRRRLFLAAAAAALAATAVIAIVLAAVGHRGYLSQIAHPGPGGVSQTFVQQAKGLSWYPLGWFGSSPTLHDGARVSLKLLSLGLLVLAAAVALRRRLGLETMIVAATIAVLLVYRTSGAGEARYLIPLSPFFVGAIFAGVRLRPHAWAFPVAALAASAAIAGDIHYYETVTPSAATFNAEVAARKGAYLWVKMHAARNSEVVALNDLQSFLYSGHPTVTAIRNFAPGRTFVVRMPPRASSDSWAAQHILDGFRGHEVYRRGAVSVVQVDARRAPA